MFTTKLKSLPNYRGLKSHCTFRTAENVLGILEILWLRAFTQEIAELWSVFDKRSCLWRGKRETKGRSLRRGRRERKESSRNRPRRIRMGRTRIRSYWLQNNLFKGYIKASSFSKNGVSSKQKDTTAEINGGKGDSYSPREIWGSGISPEVARVSIAPTMMAEKMKAGTVTTETSRSLSWTTTCIVRPLTLMSSTANCSEQWCWIFLGNICTIWPNQLVE